VVALEAPVLDDPEPLLVEGQEEGEEGEHVLHIYTIPEPGM
jgi:hypothetical protein